MAPILSLIILLLESLDFHVADATLATALLPSTHTSYLDDTADFDEVKQSFRVETPRLLLVPASWDEVELYVQLMADPETMAFYREGVAYSPDTSERLLSEWVGRWQSGDPFSALSVFLKSCSSRDTRRRAPECADLPSSSGFIGFAALNPSQMAGVAELTYAFDRHIWFRGYVTESVTAVVYAYARKLKSRGASIDGHPFTGITASPHTSNRESVQLLRSLGFEERGVSVEQGHSRYKYYRPVVGKQ
jgi:RimJ/RimL family protein N-acetyltransferase